MGDKYDNPSYFELSPEVAGAIWIALQESECTELAEALSETMINQGCQELVDASGEPVQDPLLILMFWKNFLEEKDLIHILSLIHI